MITPRDEALLVVERWREDVARQGSEVEARAKACGWELRALQSGSGIAAAHRLRRYAEPLVLDGDAFDSGNLAHTLPVRSVTFPTKRYAVTRTVWAHPKDVPALRAQGTDEAPVVVGARGRVPDLGALRRFWRQHRKTSPKAQPIGGLRRFWRENAALRVTVTLRSPGVALDREQRTVYVDGPGPWWLALDAGRVDLTRDLVLEWVAVQVSARTHEDLQRLDWLWGRMSPEQHTRANDRLFVARMRAS